MDGASLVYLGRYHLGFPTHGPIRVSFAVKWIGTLCESQRIHFTEF